ncbi:MAG: IS200/IS605 family transposase [Desulfobacterales bacterium CG23_combo_of_CG06-09_8_20_14_all_52_9]|nr:MAG: IS200/IS605 family transposase [Desulfobacterales bacterium CG23_combo_of_CG06-09_8_20_14_all_52_9]
MKFRKSAHSIYKTEYHLVWIPRYRRKVFVRGVKEYAEKVLSHVPELNPDIEVIKLNVQEDHVHMVVVIPPKYAVARVVQYIKSKSAKALKAKFPFLQKVYISGEGIWSRGYCVSGIGLNEKEILAYVEHQEKEDNGQLQLPF